METLKTEATIEQRFGAAMRYFDRVCRRGFQAEVARRTEVNTSNLSSIIRTDKGASEQVRRDIFAATLEIAESQGVGLPVPSYEDFLFLGQLVLEGKNPEDYFLDIPEYLLKKYPSEMTEEELQLVIKALEPKMRRAIAAQRQDMDETLKALARKIALPLAKSLGKAVQNAGKIAGAGSAGQPSGGPVDFFEVPKAQARLSAGNGCFVEEGIAGRYHFRSDWLRSICSPVDAILFDCVGESMWPTISDKETVLVDRGDTEFQDDKVFAIGVGDNALIKRLRLNADNMIEIISDNPDKKRFPTDTVAPDEVRILGRVRWRAGEI